MRARKISKIFSVHSMNAKLIPFIDAIDPLWPNCDAILLHFRPAQMTDFDGESALRSLSCSWLSTGQFISVSEIFRIVFEMMKSNLIASKHELIFRIQFSIRHKNHPLNSQRHSNDIENELTAPINYAPISSIPSGEEISDWKVETFRLIRMATDSHAPFNFKR